MAKKKERVSDYPRPPLVEGIEGEVMVHLGGEVIAQSSQYIRVCETFHPPTIYLPPSAFQAGTLHAATGRPSYCEWKGVANYWDLSTTQGTALRQRAGWSYGQPTARFSELTNWISLYPGLMEACYLEGERVRAQPGNFYGGWITSAVIGPFKGDPNHPELI